MRGARWMIGLAAAISAAGCELLVPVGDPKLRTCTDGIKNNDETGKDCGGSCAPCPVGEGCKTAKDCETQSCGANGICAAPSCTDGAHNGDETGKDCGGPTCPKCSAGEACKIALDCVSGLCTGAHCAPSCTDGMTDGSESDVDCGGACPGCAVGRACSGGADCDSGVCSAGKCVDFVEALVRLGPVDAADQALLAGLDVDALGNAVIAANFGGKASFGGTAVYTGVGFAFARLDPGLSHLWDAGFVGGTVDAFTANPSGELAALGTYNATSLDFGGGVVINNANPGWTNPFYVDFTETNQAASAQSYAAQGVGDGAFQGMALPSNGLSAPVVVGAGAYGDYKIGGTSVKNGDMYVIQLGVSGVSFSDSNGADAFAGVAVDSAGRIFAAGQHNGVIDFGGGPVDSAAAGQGFVIALNPTPLKYAWSKSFTAVPDALELDGGGNVILCGALSGSVDFGKGPLTNTGNAVFVAKLDPTGDALWAKAFPVAGALSKVTTLLAVDSAGNILVGVNPYSGTVDFGAGPRSGAMIVAKLDPAGTHLWSAGFGAKSQLAGLAAYNDKEILVGGTFTGTLSIGSGLPHTVESVGQDIFLAKLRLP